MSSIPLGRVLGFRVGIDRSWFIIFFLILWSFTSGVFPSQAPGLSNAIYLLMGVIGTLVFFVSLLLHELSHAVAARSRGIEVEGITLFLLGGVARTKTEASSPGDEFWIAAVGPLASFGIAVALGGLWYVGAAQGWHVGVLAVVQYLALLNVVLAVFNLLPGFPLDGGRVLRAAVWKLTGSALKATRVAAASGQVLAFALIGLGALQAFGGSVMGGLWLVFIGIFLRNAARSSLRQHVIMDMLHGVDAAHTMTPTPETIRPELSLEAVVDRHFLRSRYLSFPVVDGERALGIITLDQVKDVPREAWAVRTVGDTMAPVDRGVTVAPEAPMAEVMERLKRSPVRRLLVVRGERLLGYITEHDVASWLEKSNALGGRR